MNGPTTTPLPPLPEVGHPDAWYVSRIHHAEASGENHLREALKVGQYITLALDPHLSWDEKLKYFRHALKRHCQPSQYGDEPEVIAFYGGLARLVRDYCGAEALRLSSEEDDKYAARLSMGQQREQIEDDAEEFFSHIIGRGNECPDWFGDDDWAQLKLIRDQWI
jgi:hypothetical protein